MDFRPPICPIGTWLPLRGARVIPTGVPAVGSVAPSPEIKPGLGAILDIKHKSVGHHGVGKTNPVLCSNTRQDESYRA